MKQAQRMMPLTTSTMSGFLIRMMIFAGLWWVIADGQTESWLIGLPAVVLAALVSVSLSGHALPRLSVSGLLRFIGLFLRESISGGIDVARRTLTPALRIQPGFSRYRLRLDDQHGRVLFINCISLLPGTLAADLNGDYVELHVLDMRQDPAPQLRRIEQSIANMLQQRLEVNHV
jgi:multicomponent Na+:H+ antiporter subunit E